MKIEKLYLQHKLDKKPSYHVLTGFDRKTKEWKFLGYRCNSCEQTLRTEYLANKHRCVPSKSRKREDSFLETNEIKTVNRETWKPIKL